MSRSYEMTVRIRGANPDRVEVVKEAARFEWGFNDWYPLDHPDDAQNFAADAQSSLCGGETEEEFAERLARAVWEANGGYCEVEVQAVCLDDIPYESYLLDEDRYEELVGNASGGPDLDLPQPTKENQHG